MPRKVCIIGATETIGYYASNRLAVTGNPVKAVSTDNELFQNKKYHPDIEKIVVSDYSVGEIDNVLQDVQVCLVYKKDWKNQSEFSKNIIESARKNDVSHIVYISVMGAGSERMETVGREYDEAEYIIENSGLGWTILRHNFLMQDLLSFMEQATANFCFPTGREHVSFIDARDVAVCAAEVMISGFHFHGKTYSLTGVESYSFKQCADILSKVSGTTLHYDNCDQKLFQRILKVKNANKSELDYFLSWSMYAGSGAASAVTKDVELIAGIESTAFEDFARDNAESIREFLEHGSFTEDVL